MLTEAIEAEAIQRPKTVQDYMKIARRLKTKLFYEAIVKGEFVGACL